MSPRLTASPLLRHPPLRRRRRSLCSPYARQRTEQVRVRSARVRLGDLPSGGNGDTAQVTMVKHGFPFGAAMREACAYNDDCVDFFKDHFNWAGECRGKKLLECALLLELRSMQSAAGSCLISVTH
jgi:hypothetical protein